MFNYLRNFTDKVSYFSNQRSSGHGINTSQHLVPKECDLLIILDSSSNDVETCSILNQMGIEIVVLDHHIVEVDNPFVMLVNPQQIGCTYPNKSISGSVVTWKMTQILDDAFGTKYCNDFIDLAAIGLLGDQMNMLEYENRYIVQEGLKRKNINNKGIKSLLSTFSKDLNSLSSTDMLYSIIPAINAACRLDQIEVVLSLLTEENPKIYKQLAQDVYKLNEQRKVIQAKHYNDIVDLVSPIDKCSIIVDNSIGAGYRGLLAGDLSSEYKKPIIIVSESEDDTYKGSYRSGDYDLKSVLGSIPEVIYAAGHPQAGGVCFKKSDLNVIQDYLNNSLPNFNNDTYLEYVLEMDLEEITEELIRDVEEFYRINGNGFNVGLFKINNVFILDKDVLGKECNTIKLSVCSSSYAEKNRSWGLDSIDPTHYIMKFRTSPDFIRSKYLYKSIECVGSLNMNIWKNQRTGKVTQSKQIFLEDFKLAF